MAEEKKNDSGAKLSINIEIGKEISKSLAEIVTALLKPSATELGGMLGDTIGLASDRIRQKRELNAKLGMIEVRKRLEDAQIEIENITPPKEEELHLLLNGMSLSDDDTVRNMWAGLFAKSLDPNSEVSVERPYISVLQSLSPTDAKIIDLLAFITRTDSELRRDSKKASPKDFRNITPEERHEMEVAGAYNRQLQRNAIEAIQIKATAYGLNPVKGSGWADNLIRQGIIERVPARKISSSLPYLHSFDERELVRVFEHFSQKINSLENETNRNNFPPKTLFHNEARGGQIQMEAILTSFGTRLAEACGLI